MRQDIASLGHAASIGLWVTLALTGCGDHETTSPGASGSVEVTTATTGVGLDQDGYVVQLAGDRSAQIGINETRTLTEVPAGEVEVESAACGGIARYRRLIPESCAWAQARGSPHASTSSATACRCAAESCSPAIGRAISSSTR